MKVLSLVPAPVQLEQVKASTCDVIGCVHQIGLHEMAKFYGMIDDTLFNCQLMLSRRRWRGKFIAKSLWAVQHRLQFSLPLHITVSSQAMGSVGMDDSQRRFRRRGGAKKKKKAPSTVDAPIAAAPNASAGYVSGFQSSSTPSTLSTDLSSYLSQLQSSLQELDPDGSLATTFAGSSAADPDDPPPSVLLARNAIGELAPRVHEVARDAFGSRLLESLLRACADPCPPAALLGAALDAGPQRFAALAAHHAASHVMDAALQAIGGRWEGDEDARACLNKMADTVGKWTQSDFAEVVNSASGSHSFRAIAATLAGIPRDEPREAKLDDSERGRIRSYIERMAVDVPDEWHLALHTMTEGLLQDDAIDLQKMLWKPSSCAALQALLAGVSVGNKELALQLAEYCVKGQEDQLMRNACGSRFMERAVLCFGAKVVQDTYKGRLQELSKDPKANFVVQRILLGLRGRGQVMSAWDELEDAVPEMLGFGRAREGVVLSLLRVTEAEGDENCRRRASRSVARACGAVGERGKSFAGMLMMGSEEMWTRWQMDVKQLGRTGMGLYERMGDVLFVPRKLLSPSLLGTLIARCVMRFSGGPGQLMRDSMATLSGEELVALIGNAVGSRLVEQWVDGETLEVSKKIAAKVVNAVSGDKAEGILAAAKNPYGAQVVVRCAGVVAGPLRKIMMEAFASDFEELKKHDCGQMVLRKCRVEQYMRRGEEWEHEETTRETRERLFTDILQDDEEEDGNEVEEKAAEPEKKEKKEKKEKRKKDKKEKKEKKDKKRKRTDSDAGMEGEKSVKIAKGKESNVIFDSLYKDAEVRGDTGKGAVVRNEDNSDEEQGGSGLEKILNAIEDKAKTPDAKRSKKKDKGKKKKKKRNVSE